MLPIQRHDKILSELIKKRYLRVEEVMKLTGATVPTTQRDLAHLDKTGQVRRMRGGISSIETDFDQTGQQAVNKPELLAAQNTISISGATAHALEKEAIGRKAQELIQEGDTLFITHGTTSSQVARFIGNEKKLTVITDGIDVMACLTDRPNVRVILTGGIVNYATRQVEESPLIHCGISDININTLFMGAGGIDGNKGITFYDFNSCAVLEKFIHEILRVVVVADHTKFGRVSLARFIHLENVTDIITDSGLDPAYAELVKTKGIRLHMANCSPIA